MANFYKTIYQLELESRAKRQRHFVHGVVAVLLIAGFMGRIAGVI